MAAVTTRRLGRDVFNGFDVNEYGFLPQHLIEKDQAASSFGFADYWDAGNTAIEYVGPLGKTSYTIITVNPPVKGTIAIFSGSQVLIDDGEGLITDVGGTAKGTVNYETGRVVAEFDSTTVYDVYITYVTGQTTDAAEQFDEDNAVWDRITEQPVIQRLFWGIELDATQISRTIDGFENLNYVDKITQENAQYAFESYGFDDQIVDLDTDLQRAWLRELRNMWQLKGSYRMWVRLLSNLGFDTNIYPLFKSHPLNNYGANPGEIYSRIHNEITIAQQELYERALKAAGYDPTAVTNPATGTSVSYAAGQASGTELVYFQVNIANYPPDYSTMTIQLQSKVDSSYDLEGLTLDSSTGDITGSLAAEGSINLTSGSGYINFHRDIGVEYSVILSYTTMGAAYQAARVDVEFETDEDYAYKSGDRAANAILRALEYVRPIHVLIRILNMIITDEDDATVSEGSCCGPQILDTEEFEYEKYYSTGSIAAAAGARLYSGSITTVPVKRGTFVLEDSVSGQTATDDGIGGMTGNGIGAINYNTGVWMVYFDTVTAGIPVLSYDYYVVDTLAQKTHVRYMADQFNMDEVGEEKRDYDELSVEYADIDIDSEYLEISGDVVADPNYAGTLHTNVIAGTLYLQDYDTGQTVTDDGAGNLVGDIGIGANSIVYATGVYDVTFSAATSGYPVAVYEFTSSSAHVTDQEDIHKTVEDDAVLEGDYIDISEVYGTYSESLGGAGSTTYTGTLTNIDIIPGTTTIFEDPGLAQSLDDTTSISAISGTGGTGTINYLTKAISVTFSQVTTVDPTIYYEYYDSEGFRIKVWDTLGTAGSTTYTGTLTGSIIVPGSILIKETELGYSLTDDGEITLNGDGTGTLNYISGAYNITYLLVTVDSVTAEYDYNNNFSY